MFPVSMQVLGTRMFEPSLTSERPMSEWIGSEVVVGEEADSTQQEDQAFIPPLIEMEEGVALQDKEAEPHHTKCTKPYHLTSNEHFDYMLKRNKTKKSKKGAKALKKNTATPGTSKEGSDVCRVCNFRYGGIDDPKKTEEWVKCSLCEGWFHQTCAEENGIIDDSCFNCTDCLFGEEP